MSLLAITSKIYVVDHLVYMTLVLSPSVPCQVIIAACILNAVKIPPKEESVTIRSLYELQLGVGCLEP